MDTFKVGTRHVGHAFAEMVRDLTQGNNTDDMAVTTNHFGKFPSEETWPKRFEEACWTTRLDGRLERRLWCGTSVNLSGWSAGICSQKTASAKQRTTSKTWTSVSLEPVCLSTANLQRRSWN